MDSEGRCGKFRPILNPFAKTYACTFADEGRALLLQVPHDRREELLIKGGLNPKNDLLNLTLKYDVRLQTSRRTTSLHFLVTPCGTCPISVTSALASSLSVTLQNCDPRRLIPRHRPSLNELVMAGFTQIFLKEYVRRLNSKTLTNGLHKMQLLPAISSGLRCLKSTTLHRLNRATNRTVIM